jgi:hypothetical protein
MIETAERERDRISRDLTGQLDAHLDAARRRASQEAWELIRLTEAEVDGIRAWAASEHERVRDEAEGRIAARRAELGRLLSQQEMDLAREIAATSDAVRAYRAELDGFVRGLGKERDPTRIARRATQLPPPPHLQDLATAARDQASTGARLVSDGPVVRRLVARNGNAAPSNGDLVGVMDPGVSRPTAASIGEMVGAHRPEHLSTAPLGASRGAAPSTPPDVPVEPPIAPKAPIVEHEARTEVLGRPDWTDVALRFLPVIVFVAIALAVAYLLISGEANALAG